jgi:hypothetical protein
MVVRLDDYGLDVGVPELIYDGFNDHRVGRRPRLPVLRRDEVDFYQRPFPALHNVSVIDQVECAVDWFESSFTLDDGDLWHFYQV